MKRYITSNIIKDLASKMVFVGGPRQVGKTTLSYQLIKSDQTSEAYLNWDDTFDRKKILAGEFPPDQKIVVLDEIHKYRLWRGLVKGFYDKRKSKHSFLVTGSARLDYYRRGGDSLQGRYHYYRLHPLSVGELLNSKQEVDIKRLLKYGGFPEPYLLGDDRSWRRWQQDRVTRVLQEDLISLEKVNEISSLQILIDTLPSKVASILSIKSLAEDLEVAHSTVKRWVQILDNLYFSFRLSPYGAPKIRAVKKEQKLYLWDWSSCENEGGRFENMVASQLLKYCHYREDTEGYRMELRYIRDTDKREVDFVVLENKKAIFAVEAKMSEENISPHLKYFSQRIKLDKWYQVHLGERHYEKDDIEVIPFVKFVKKLGLP